MRNLFRIAHLEGWSYLLLLFVAMPLKYLGSIDYAVRITGSLHGLLFLALSFSVLANYIKNHINLRTAIFLMVASLIPFATFYSEKITLKYNHRNTLSH
jgi:integral membrane protein